MLEKIIAALEMEDLSLAKQWMDTIDLQIAEGTPEDLAQRTDTPTGIFLKNLIK